MAGDTLSLSTTNVADVNVYSVNLTIGLQYFPEVPPITKIFSVTITCEVLSLSFDQTSPLLEAVAIGITAQPFSIPFSVTLFPACTQVPVFTLSAVPAFITSFSAGNGGAV